MTTSPPTFLLQGSLPLPMPRHPGSNGTSTQSCQLAVSDAVGLSRPE